MSAIFFFENRVEFIYWDRLFGHLIIWYELIRVLRSTQDSPACRHVFVASVFLQTGGAESDLYTYWSVYKRNWFRLDAWFFCYGWGEGCEAVRSVSWYWLLIICCPAGALLVVNRVSCQAPEERQVANMNGSRRSELRRSGTMKSSCLPRGSGWQGRG